VWAFSKVSLEVRRSRLSPLSPSQWQDLVDLSRVKIKYVVWINLITLLLKIKFTNQDQVKLPSRHSKVKDKNKITVLTS